MSRREGQLFVGRLSKTTRTRDLEEIFERYGRLTRCEVKYGVEVAYAFVDFEDYRDAEDCIKYENGRDVCGSSIIVEWAKGSPRRPLSYDSWSHYCVLLHDVDCCRAMTNATDVIDLGTGRGIVPMIDGVVVVVVVAVAAAAAAVAVSGTADLVVVAALLLAGGEVIQDQGLVTAAGAQGLDQGIDAGVHDLVTVAAEVAARATSASPPAESLMTARTASPGTESLAASPEAAPGPSPSRGPGPSPGADPQSSRMGTGMGGMWASRRKGVGAPPAAIQAAPTEGTARGEGRVWGKGMHIHSGGQQNWVRLVEVSFIRGRQEGRKLCHCVMHVHWCCFVSPQLFILLELQNS